MATKVLIGSAEAGRLLGLTRNGVNRRVDAGQLIPVGRIGRRGIHVFDRAEIERLAESEAKNDR